MIVLVSWSVLETEDIECFLLLGFILCYTVLFERIESLKVKPSRGLKLILVLHSLQIGTMGLGLRRPYLLDEYFSIALNVLKFVTGSESPILAYFFLMYLSTTNLLISSRLELGLGFLNNTVFTMSCQYSLARRRCTSNSLAPSAPPTHVAMCPAWWI